MTTADPPVESPESRPAPLIPVAESRIPFHGDTIVAVLVGDPATPVIMVPVRPLSDRLGLSWPAQYRRIVRDPVLAAAAATVAVTATDGRRRQVVCLPAAMLHGWLFGVSAQRVKQEHREALNVYRSECFEVLWRAYQAGELGTQSRGPESTQNTGHAGLAHLRATALAVAALAEQQMAMETRLDATEDRLNRAAAVVGRLTTRVTVLEDAVGTIALVSDAQATEISQAVKALAQLMTQRETGTTRPYATVFGELYRRFGVTSYKHIPVDRLADVLKFLDDWRQSILAGDDARQPNADG